MTLVRPKKGLLLFSHLSDHESHMSRTLGYMICRALPLVFFTTQSLRKELHSTITVVKVLPYLLSSLLAFHKNNSIWIILFSYSRVSLKQDLVYNPRALRISSTLFSNCV